MRIDMGRYETKDEHGNHHRMMLPLPGWKGAHWLVGASTGAGKTWTMKLALAQICRLLGPKVAFALCDPDFVNYKTFTPRASIIGFGGETALPVIHTVKQEMDRRFKFMWENDIEEWSPEIADEVGPYMILVLEEMKAISQLPSPTGKGKLSAIETLISLAQRGRKTGCGLMLATQFPNVKTIPNDILAQCAVRWCGRTQEPEQTEAVLGNRRWPCHDGGHPKGIPMDLPGIAYVNDGFTVRRGRTTGIAPDKFAGVALAHATDRFDFGWEHVLLPADLKAKQEVQIP